MLPVMIDRAAPPPAHELPEDIRGLVARETEEIRHKYFDRDMDDVIAVIEARRAEVTKAGKAAPVGGSGVADVHSAAEREWQRHGLDQATDAGLIAAFAARWKDHDPFWAHIARQRGATLEREAADRAKIAEADAARRQTEELGRRHDADWQRACALATVAGYEAFLAAWRGGPHVAKAQEKLLALILS